MLGHHFVLYFIRVTKVFINFRASNSCIIRCFYNAFQCLFMPFCLHKASGALWLGCLFSLVFYSGLMTLWCLWAADGSHNEVFFAGFCMICVVFGKTHFASNICVLQSKHVICRHALKHNILQNRCFVKGVSMKSVWYGMSPSSFPRLGLTLWGVWAWEQTIGRVEKKTHEGGPPELKKIL
jgi:hypothetical protein